MSEQENNNQINELKKIISRMQLLLDEAKIILSGENKFTSVDFRQVAQQKGSETDTPQGRIIEGVFDGQRMIGPDGKQYTVPPNYASKSKLVEGDMLKLTIGPDGTFLYKQIGPVERNRIVGTLTYDDIEKQYYGQTDSRRYKLITAAVTYFKGEEGDEVIMLVPRDESSTWAAVENIIKKTPQTSSSSATAVEPIEKQTNVTSSDISLFQQADKEMTGEQSTDNNTQPIENQADQNSQNNDENGFINL